MHFAHHPDLDSQPIKRLIVAPHGDDEALGCGGLLAKYPEDTGVAVLAKLDDVREKEFDRAREILGYERAYFFDLPDGEVGNDMPMLVRSLDRLMELVRPNELYLPYPSMHQDHIAVYEAGIRTSRLSSSASHWFPPNVLVYDVAVYDVAMYPTDLRWNVFLSLNEDQINKKVEAMSAYQSQVVEGPHPINGLKGMAHTLGVARHIQYAEQFALVREVRT